MPVGEVVHHEIEVLAAHRQRAQRAAFHPPRIVLLEEAHRALDVPGLELGRAAHERLVLEAEVHGGAERQRDAEQHYHGHPVQQPFHAAGT